MKQNGSLKIIGLIMGMFFALSGHAQICSAPVVNATNNYGYNLFGIGDGCTLKNELGGVTWNAEWIPNINFFKGTFTGSCDRHDKCLTQIGNNAQSCHSEFYSNMRNACNSKYKWYQPVERSICRDTAYQYYATVQRAQNDEETFKMQNATRQASLEIQNSIESETCGSSSTRLQLYSDTLIAEINNSFLTNSGRLPTIFEFLNAVNSTNYNSDRSNWYLNLQRLSVNAASVIIPTVSILADTSYGLQLTANNSHLNYVWKVNGQTSYNQTLYLVDSEPMYNTSVNAKGFLTVNSGTNSSRNMIIIDQTYLLMGGCSSGPGYACN